MLQNNHQIKLQSFSKYFDTFDILPLISYKHGIYELPHKLPNDLRLNKFGNIRKVSKLHRMIP